jgi:aldose sugar dehydrogenase
MLLEFKVLFNGPKNPTSMAFLGQNDILVLQKDKGTVKRIVNGNMLSKSLLDVNVATQGGRGMLGIDNLICGKKHVLYVTHPSSAICSV